MSKEIQAVRCIHSIDDTISINMEEKRDTHNIALVKRNIITIQGGGNNVN